MSFSGSLIVPCQLSPPGLLPPVVWCDPSDAVWYCVVLCHVTVGQHVWAMPTTTPLHGSGCLHVVATTRSLSRPGAGSCGTHQEPSPYGPGPPHAAPPGKLGVKHWWCRGATLVPVYMPAFPTAPPGGTTVTPSSRSFLPRGGPRSGYRPGTIHH